MRTPEYPNFKTRAELLLEGIPVLISTKDWPLAIDKVESQLRYVFTEGLQEARERLIANPALIHERDL